MERFTLQVMKNIFIIFFILVASCPFFHIVDKKSSFLQYGHHSNPDQIITVDITFVTKVGTRSTSSV